MDLNLLVGSSHFVYGLSDAELRRSGTMRPAQLVKRTILEKRFGRPDPRATQKSIEELLRRVLPPGSRALIRSDEHQAYPRAIRKLRDRSIVHETTSSKATRTTQNPLFPVNLADMLLRHSSSNHKRETIAFSKRRQAVLYRAAIWLVWRNYLKDRSENRKAGPPAKTLGLVQKSLNVKEILVKRLFPEREGISGWLAACYFGRIPTRAIPNGVAHTAIYAI
jgi:hypothetical protein